eukprot:820901-Amphidinium_carterae.1
MLDEPLRHPWIGGVSLPPCQASVPRELRHQGQSSDIININPLNVQTQRSYPQSDLRKVTNTFVTGPYRDKSCKCCGKLRTS